MLTVHYLNNSRAHRILWLLEELGVPYAVKNYARTSEYLAPDTLKKVHPLGKSPVVVDGDISVAESGAIFDYLLRTYGDGRLVPNEGADEWRRYVYWMHYSEGSAMPLLVMKLVFSQIPARVPFIIRPIAKLISNAVLQKLVDPQLATHLKFWNDELVRDGWFAGSVFTAADIIMSYPIEAGVSRLKASGDVAGISAYMAAIRQRPAYVRALEKGGAYDFVTTQV